ncbi:MAG: undecaprenyldiphospho-muramoylpentapeptide beta-N-acetylglucosaminyltransferase [Candidatus Melainabacteria bacterium RIFCSPHIGHO2_02_FULL_34_12]|nr:MAG: undecaprenyldiphospho-muramoylpentapeptide beta-N-acetylglucosaminyltransferase [Candidatus Melainabacteria bacterium RIFCSPHIGHO2_02_FULL_34_12]
MKKIVLCGGGTGGHIFPNIAISEILKKEGCDLYYIGVIGKPEETIADENGIDFYGYEFSGFPRKLQKELLLWPINLLKAISKAKLYLKHFKPDIIFGTGGYSSAPVFIAAKRLKVPYIIHNLDKRLGLANKFCANGASALTLGFDTEEVHKSSESLVTGNPIRKSFLEITKTNKSDLYKEFKLDPGKKTIFVIGGSQGANAINEVILELLKELVMNNNIQVIHQTGEFTHEVFSKRIPAAVMESMAYVASPFFENPEKCYHLADLIISRSGAMTTTEVTIMGKPAIFIPFPYAGNHQEANIMHLIDSGGAILIKQKGLRSKELLNTILALINNPAKLEEMSKITKSFAKPNATEDIANLILSKIGQESNNKENLTGVI